MGSALQAQPEVGGGHQQAGSQKSETRSAQLRPPAHGVFVQHQLQPNKLRLLAEARGQGPGSVIACQRKGGEDFFLPAPRAPERAAEARAEAALVAVEPEAELSKFQLWQGPAERREVFPEQPLVASV